MNIFNKVLGSGLALKKMFNLGGPGTSAELERIFDSIYNILSTRIGERVCLPEFGSNLHKLVFNQNSLSFRQDVSSEIRKALNRWEPRIIINAVTIPSNMTNNMVPIKIDFILKDLNLQGTYIYPFMVNPEAIGF